MKNLKMKASEAEAKLIIPLLLELGWSIENNSRSTSIRDGIHIYMQTDKEAVLDYDNLIYKIAPQEEISAYDFIKKLRKKIAKKSKSYKVKVTAEESVELQKLLQKLGYRWPIHIGIEIIDFEKDHYLYLSKDRLIMKSEARNKEDKKFFEDQKEKEISYKKLFKKLNNKIKEYKLWCL